MAENSELKAVLIQLEKNLNILQEREAKYAGNAPLELLNQIADHREAIELTKQTIAGGLSEAEWGQALQPLLVNINAKTAGGATIAATTFDQRGQQVGSQYNVAGNLVIQQESPPAQPPDPATLAVAEQDYREQLKKDHGDVAPYFVPQAGLTTEQTEARRTPKVLQLARRHRRQAKAEVKEWIQAGQEIKQITLNSLREGVEKYPCIILLGDPGSGKTTALGNLALEFAEKADKLPLLLPLSEFEPGMTVEDFIKHSSHTPQVLANHLAHYLETGSLFFLFDALNEMPRSEYGQRSRALRSFIDQWSAAGNRFVVTCRVLDYGEELSGLQRVEVQPFDDARIKAFIQNVLPNTWADLWDTLTAEKDKQRQLLEMARNPYMLTIMAVIFGEEGQLSPNRAELLTDFTEMLLTWAAETTPRDKWLDAEVQREALSILAFEMQKSGAGTTAKTYELELPEKIQPNKKMIAAPPVKEILTLAANANLIEMPVDRSSVRFYHQLLQEYFAARHLLKQDPNNLHDLWRWPWLEREMPLWVRPENNREPLPPPPPTNWEETTILAAGLAPKNDDQLVRALLKINPVLAGRCLYQGQARVDGATRQAVIDALLSTIGQADVALRVRIAAGEILGDLGDPRLGELVTIPAGEFLMGEGKVQHEVTLPVYQIGKYPLTNAEYAHFIKAGGYQEQRWWTAAGWTWKGSSTEPYYWNDSRFNKPNQPVIGVSWYEAVAYCHWLSAETGQQVRLPTEAEWEKAARGPDGPIFPWGNAFDAGQLNAYEGEQQVRVTTPVGIYPGGVSHFGLFDCAGNIWEWCATQRGKSYPYNVQENEWSSRYLDGTNVRVLRGGSWNFDEDYARCAYRHADYPYNGDDDYGVRVVVVSPSF